MSNTLVRRCIPWAVRWALMTIGFGATIDDAAATSSLRACAARDRQVLMLIEERQDANLVTAQTLSEALFSMMRARIVCRDGRVSDALALYDGIAASVTSDRVDRFDGPDTRDEVGAIRTPKGRAPYGEWPPQR
jgi:hypothetical protein